jgi:hypothetical protein
MLRVESKIGNTWMIIDSKDDIIFAGTMQEVEDWLDHHENLRRRPSIRGAWHRIFLDAVLWPFRRVSGCCHGRIRST